MLDFILLTEFFKLRIGRIYGRPAERAAFDAGYAVDTEVYSGGAWNPTDEEIDRLYKGIYY